MAGAKPALQAAAQRRFKGKYAGPDKYKGVIPPHLRGKYKGKYFGKEKYKGGNPTRFERAKMATAEAVNSPKPVNPRDPTGSYGRKFAKMKLGNRQPFMRKGGTPKNTGANGRVSTSFATQNAGAVGNFLNKLNK